MEPVPVPMWSQPGVELYSLSFYFGKLRGLPQISSLSIHSKEQCVSKSPAWELCGWGRRKGEWWLWNILAGKVPCEICCGYTLKVYSLGLEGLIWRDTWILLGWCNPRSQQLRNWRPGSTLEMWVSIPGNIYLLVCIMVPLPVHVSPAQTSVLLSSKECLLE